MYDKCILFHRYILGNTGVVYQVLHKCNTWYTTRIFPSICEIICHLIHVSYGDIGDWIIHVWQMKETTCGYKYTHTQLLVYSAVDYKEVLCVAVAPSLS